MKLPLALGAPHKWFTWLDVITCFCWKLKVKSNLIQRVTTEFPYVGKLITSRILRLCQVSQKWPVIFLWLLLMLDYINYHAPAQQGFWTCFASEIQCEVIKRKEQVFVKIHHSLCSKLWIWGSLLHTAFYCKQACSLHFFSLFFNSRLPTVSNRHWCCAIYRDASTWSAPGQTCVPKGKRRHGQSHWVSCWRWASEQVHNPTFYTETVSCQEYIYMHWYPFTSFLCIMLRCYNGGIPNMSL